EVCYQRDELGRCTSVTDECGAVWKLSYERGLRPVAILDPEGGTTRYDYDAHGNVTGVHSASGKVYRFQREPTRTGAIVLTVQDPAGAARRLSYDVWGRLRRVEDALGNRMEWTLDLCSRVTAVLLPDGRRIRYGYDKEGRCVLEEYPGG